MRVLLPQSLDPDFFQVNKPLSLIQEHPRCGGKQGAPGSPGLVKGIRPCPVVRSLAAVCCVCNAGTFGLLWAAGSAPSLPHFCLLVHSNPLLLFPSSGTQTVPQHVLGRGSGGGCPMHFPYTCASNRMEYLCLRLPQGLYILFVHLQLSNPPGLLRKSTCLCPMVGWTLLGSPDDPTFNAQSSP